MAINLSGALVRISYLLPKPWVYAARDILVRGGYGAARYRQFVGFALAFSFILSANFALYFYIATSDAQFSIAGGIFMLVLELLGVNYMLTSAAFRRAQKIEVLLPDALRIISFNMRAGMTVENAVWSAARPEFGPLRDEIGKVAADTFGGKPIEDALSDMPARVDSRVLERAIRLMVEGLRLGGRMTDLLDEVASDIASYQALQEQIATSTTTYSLFIMFASLFAAPLLFSVSTFYAEMNEKTLSTYAASSSSVASSIASRGLSGLPMGISSTVMQGGISFEDVRLFSVAVLFLTSFFAAILIWQIKEGNPHKGLAYTPVFVGVAFAVFFIGLSLLEGVIFRLF